MVGSKENYKFDVGVKGLIISLLGIIVSCLHMFGILHALISLISMWVLTILPGKVMWRTMQELCNMSFFSCGEITSDGVCSMSEDKIKPNAGMNHKDHVNNPTLFKIFINCHYI